MGLDETTPVRIQTARETLRLVLENGLENALKYTPSSGEGSGLGCAIAGKAAAALGGSLTLLGGAPGAGLIFRYRHGHPSS